MLRAAVLALGLTFGLGVQAVFAADLPLGSAHAIVVDEATGEVLLDKDGSTAAPIASMTKLMTAMVVLDAQQDPNEALSVTEDDLDTLKHTRSGVRPGTTAPRITLLELALVASDNHAAHALARNYPGGMPAFLEAVQQKAQALGLEHTVIEEPTGLSANNRSSAMDMVRIVRAAAQYPAITDVTSRRQDVVTVNGRHWLVRNTNGLVGAPGWNILLSKTGFTNEAGRCLSMRLEAAGRTVAVVLMGAVNSSGRALDAINIRRWLAGEPPVSAQMVAQNTPHRARGHRSLRHGGVVRVKAQAAPAAPLPIPDDPAV
jgi:D-alanyl-D-alanine carboxypeptidase/D-alanyl-D-alanine endopeptidase (penicillin-binding protein 7)